MRRFALLTILLTLMLALPAAAQVKGPGSAASDPPAAATVEIPADLLKGLEQAFEERSRSEMVLQTAKALSDAKAAQYNAVFFEVMAKLKLSPDEWGLEQNKDGVLVFGRKPPPPKPVPQEKKP